jgi:hypothetical protein
MIILKVYVDDDIGSKPESNSPVTAYRDAVFAFPVTSKRMKLPAWHGRHLGEVISKLQRGEDRLYFPDKVTRNSAHVIIFVKASEAFVAELSDNHDGLYGTTVRLSIRSL